MPGDKLNPVLVTRADTGVESSWLDRLACISPALRRNEGFGRERGAKQAQPGSAEIDMPRLPAGDRHQARPQRQLLDAHSSSPLGQGSRPARRSQGHTLPHRPRSPDPGAILRHRSWRLSEELSAISNRKTSTIHYLIALRNPAISTSLAAERDQRGARVPQRGLTHNEDLSSPVHAGQVWFLPRESLSHEPPAKPSRKSFCGRLVNRTWPPCPTPQYHCPSRPSSGTS